MDEPAQTETKKRRERGEAQAPAPAPASLPLLYKSLRPLHLKEHAGLGLKTPASFSFAADVATVPLLMGEIAAASRDYPIIFSNDAVPMPIAILGLRKGQNLFVGANGGWRSAAYLPAYVRRHPFLLVSQKDSERKILAIDENCPNLVQAGGTPLIVDGAPSELAQQAMRFCETFAAEEAKTREFTLALVHHDLLEPRTFTVALGTRKMTLKDLRVVAAKKFDELPDDLFLDWRRHNWLLPIYCHIQSAGNWQRLAQFAANRASRRQKAAADSD